MFKKLKIWIPLLNGFVIGSGLGRDDLMLDYIPDILKLVSKE